MRVLAIIPAHNEEESIGQVIDEIMLAEIDFIVVNDGSTDRTETILKEKSCPYLNMVTNMGLTCAFRTGMRYAYEMGYEAVVQIDADGQHKPKYISTMIKAMQDNKADIVIASRYKNAERHGFSMRLMGGELLSKFVSWTTGVKITDPTSGMRLYNRKVMKEYLQHVYYSPEPDTICLLLHKGMKVVEIGAMMRERVAGDSYLSTIKALEYMAAMITAIFLSKWLRR